MKSPSCGEIVTQIIDNFKEYLMEKLLTYKSLDDRQELVNRAMYHFNTTLDNLIRKLKSEDNALFAAMPRNFLFYQQCVEGQDLKSILLGEYSVLESALESALEPEDQLQIVIHTENLTFLAGALNCDKTSHYGLGLIYDEPPKMIGYFMLFWIYQGVFLKGGARYIIEKDLHEHRQMMLGILHIKFPIFDLPKEIDSSTEFHLSNKFLITLNEIECEAELNEQREFVVLVKTLFDKILLL
jgi:hypothetical protein